MAPANEIKVPSRNKVTFFFSVISFRKKTANKALTTQHNSANGYAFQIPIERTAIVANIFPIAHITPETMIGNQIFMFSLLSQFRLLFTQ